MLKIQYGGKKGKKQWTIFRHNGPFFPSEYQHQNIPLIINNKKIILPKLAEEYALLYSKYLDTNYINNKFNKNFWYDFKKVLPKELKIYNLNDMNFINFKKHLNYIKNKKINISSDKKEQIKKIKQEREEPYKYCIIDGVKQVVGNYKIEPPGIFLGRGSHPKIGRIKPRIYPEDVTINLDKKALIPKPNLLNHKWGKIIHNNDVIWLATWKDSITGKNKYIFTSMESIFKSKSDEDKFDLAKKLKRKVSYIRDLYEKKLLSDDIKIKQLATALYFVDKMALRIGGKKNTKEKADTVGVSSLRVEHILLIPPNIIKLDFLGKDSIRYCKKIAVSTNIYNNINLFIQNKNKKEQLFDLINTSTINNYLNSLMPKLTAKVWRTYNASYLFQKELDKIKPEKLLKINETDKLKYLISLFNQANTEVALLCNHQKNISSNLDEQVNKLNKRIKELIKKKKKYKKNKEKSFKINSKIKLLKIKKDTKMKMKNVSLSTSRNNYIDPRIIFAFIKKFNIPINKLFTEKSLKRFSWASNVDKKYRF